MHITSTLISIISGHTVRTRHHTLHYSKSRTTVHVEQQNKMAKQSLSAKRLKLDTVHVAYLSIVGYKKRSGSIVSHEVIRKQFNPSVIAVKDDDFIRSFHLRNKVIFG